MSDKKHYYMGGEVTQEERDKMKEFARIRDEETKKLSEQQIISDKTKKIITLEMLLKTRISPQEDRVVVWPDPVEEVTESGIIKPQEVINQERPLIGTVLAVGPGKMTQQNLTNKLLLNVLKHGTQVEEKEIDALEEEIDNSFKVSLQPGDRIMYGRFAGTPVEDPNTKAELLIMRPMDIFGKIR